MKMTIATETTRFAELGRDSRPDRHAGSTLRLIHAMVPNGEPESGQTTKVLE